MEREKEKLRKKLLLLFLATALSAVILFSASFFMKRNMNAAGDPYTGTLPYKKLGEYIDTASYPGGWWGAASGNYWGPDYVGHTVTDNSGMSGDCGITHTHDRNTGKQWTSEPYPDQGKAFVINVHPTRYEQLGLMFVGNYCAGGQTDKGMRNVLIQYWGPDPAGGIDGWNNLGMYEFARAPEGGGRVKATNTTTPASPGGPPMPVDFGGVTARAIAIIPNPITGGADSGNYGADRYGLAKIQLYRYKEEAKPGNELKASPMGFYAEDSEYLVSNGAGLSDCAIPSTTAIPASLATAAQRTPENVSDITHNSNPAHMWNSDARDIYFDFAGSYPVSKLAIWNYNDVNHLDYGLRAIEVSVSSNGAAPPEAWAKVTAGAKNDGTYDVPIGTGQTQMKPSVIIDCGNAVGQFVRIKFVYNWGGTAGPENALCFGLSAVRFFCGEGYYTEPADEWTSLVSNYGANNGTVWSGADGTYALALQGGAENQLNLRPVTQKTLFYFSDTDLFNGSGNWIDERVHLKGGSGNQMQCNTFAVFTGNDPFTGSMQFHYNGYGGTAFLEPSGNPNNPGAGGGRCSDFAWTNSHPRYWLGGGANVNGNILISSHLIVGNVPGDVDFAHAGVDMSWTPASNLEGGTFGSWNKVGALGGDAQGMAKIAYAGGYTNPQGGRYTEAAVMGAGMMLGEDGYVYNYGIHDKGTAVRQMIVARAPAHLAADWSSYTVLCNDGSWGNLPAQTISQFHAAVKDVLANVSAELSVSKLTFGPQAGKYIAVSQVDTTSKVTAAAIGDNPWGPFSGLNPVYFTNREDIVNFRLTANGKSIVPGNVSTLYNGKALPAISREGELILCYNMGSSWDSPDSYHSRFLRYSYTGPAAAGPTVTTKYAVAFTANGTVLKTVTVDAGAVINPALIPEAPPIPGRKFTGWSRDMSVPITNNITVDARYEYKW